MAPSPCLMYSLSCLDLDACCPWNVANDVDSDDAVTVNDVVFALSVRSRLLKFETMHLMLMDINWRNHSLNMDVFVWGSSLKLPFHEQACVFRPCFLLTVTTALGQSLSTEGPLFDLDTDNVSNECAPEKILTRRATQHSCLSEGRARRHEIRGMPKLCV